MRRGPIITWQTSGDHRFQNKLNPIAEWREYFSQHQFSLDTPWRETPAGFQRRFCSHWRQYDGATMNPYTQSPDWFNQCGGTSFFEGWDLLEIGDQIKVEHFAKAFEFRRLQDCHVFAVPKRFTNKVAFAAIVEAFESWLKAELEKQGNEQNEAFISKRRYQELLRGEVQWGLFLYCWQRIHDRHNPVGRGVAFESYVQNIYARDHDLEWHKAWQSKQVQIERDYCDMEQLVQATFRRFDWSKLLSAKP